MARSAGTGADHYNFLQPCSPEQAHLAAEVFAPTPGFDHAAFHCDLNRVVRFFSEQLRAAKTD